MYTRRCASQAEVRGGLREWGEVFSEMCLAQLKSNVGSTTFNAQTLAREISVGDAVVRKDRYQR